MTAYADDPLIADDIRELWLERAALYEQDGNMTRPEAEDAARYWLHGYTEARHDR